MAGATKKRGKQNVLVPLGVVINIEHLLYQLKQKLKWFNFLPSHVLDPSKREVIRTLPTV